MFANPQLDASEVGEDLEHQLLLAARLHNDGIKLVEDEAGTVEEECTHRNILPQT